MGLRAFTAPDGSQWQVWSVSPGGLQATLERRQGDRRGQDVLAYTGLERRKADRRRGTRLPGVSEGLRGGWLCFQSDDERRRLVPVPPGWEESEDAELIRLWQLAEPKR